MTERKHKSDILVSLALVALFLVFAVFAALLGADIYGSVSDSAKTGSERRVALLYLEQRVRQSESINVIESDFGSALALTDPDLGREYTTYVYVSGGKLCELTAAAGDKPDWSLGQPVLDAASLSVTSSGGLYTMTVGFTYGKSAVCRVWKEVTP